MSKQLQIKQKANVLNLKSETSIKEILGYVLGSNFKYYKCDSIHIAGPFVVHVLHHRQHQTPQSYRGNKVIFCFCFPIVNHFDNCYL